MLLRAERGAGVVGSCGGALHERMEEPEGGYIVYVVYIEHQFKI